MSQPDYKTKKCPKCGVAMRITKDEMTVNNSTGDADYNYLEYICSICGKRDMQMIVFTSNF